MKYIILALILLSTTVQLLAAPTVEVTDLMHVKVDGVNKGTVVDAIANVPEARAAVLDWLVKWQKDQTSAADAALSAAQAAAAADKAKLIEVFAQIDKLDTGTTAEKKIAIAELKKTDKQRRKAEAAAKVAAAQKELEDASK